MKRTKILINTISLLSMLTGIAKYTFVISKHILQREQDIELSKKLYSPEVVAKEQVAVFEEGIKE